MSEWRQENEISSYLGVPYLEEYGGYVVRVDGSSNPEKWFAYEWSESESKHIWVGEAPTREVAQTAVKAEFLCEIYRSDEKGHCPFSGAIVRTILYREDRLRTVLCGEHARAFKSWESFRLEEYRAQHGLIPDAPIIGERIAVPLAHSSIREGVKGSATTTERNAWIALGRVVRPLAELQYWRGHFARYPLDLNGRPRMDAYGQWKRAQQHAEGMYAVYMREDQGQENATLPNDLLLLVEREAVEHLKRRKESWK